ncbi:MAG: SlyX family protein [Candidatus Omnitrophica bacterium]|nr:SlyX family protein [Candidatus Omnitrophota bacterium]
MEERIIELEKKVSFQDNTIEELNQVVIEQQKKIDQLQRELQRLKEFVTSGDLVRKLEDEEPPPHY